MSGEAGTTAPQQRVFLMDGQAVYLEGDGDITDEVLQQALSQLTARHGDTASDILTTTTTAGTAAAAVTTTAHDTTATVHTIEMPVAEDAVHVGDPQQQQPEEGGGDGEGVVVESGDCEDDGEEGVLAVLQDENGQQQTVRLTPDQAAALGINYSELVAAASVAAAQQDDEAGAEGETLILPETGDSVMEQHDTAVAASSLDDSQSAREVASLASSVMLDLHDKPSLVNHTVGGNKVTYTFEVVDDKDSIGKTQIDTAASAVSHSVPATSNQDLLVKSRQLMVPQLRTDQQQTLSPTAQQSAVVRKTGVNSQVFKPGTVPRSAYPADIVTSGIGGIGSTRTPVRSGRTKTAVTPQHFVAHKKPVVQSSSSTAAAAAAAAGSDDADMPVIMTPMCGQVLPDYIETRPGLKILVRPLEQEDGGEAGGVPAVRPLGSSDNPIQLVQQGNTFKSMQPLTADQLRQIATVLQQSRLNIPANTKNTIYDSHTNTRIVYRVVYPEDGGKQRPYRGRGRGRGSTAAGRVVGRPPRVADIVDSVDSGDADWSPSLEYNRDAKKRSTTKTRTGRVSKPPKYMVKDYRHIHRLDLNAPDLDDSDGGYSEWDYDDDDELQDEQDSKQDPPPSSKNSNADEDGDEPVEGGETDKPRAKRPISQSMRDRFGCRTCGAICIGYMRLEGHFRKNPTHERPPYIPTKAAAAAAAAATQASSVANNTSTTALVKKRPPGRPVGRPPSVKRPRVEQSVDTDTIANWGPEELFAVMLELADGSVERLFDTMSACTDLFRQHMARRLTPLQSAFSSINGADVTTVSVTSSRAQLAAVAEGLYAVDSDGSCDAAAGSVRVAAGLKIASVTGGSGGEDMQNIEQTAARQVNNTSATDNGVSEVSHVLEEFVDGLVDTSHYDDHADTGTSMTSSSSTATVAAVFCSDDQPMPAVDADNFAGQFSDPVAALVTSGVLDQKDSETQSDKTSLQDVQQQQRRLGADLAADTSVVVGAAGDSVAHSMPILEDR